jgi:hypothetical protein
MDEPKLILAGLAVLALLSGAAYVAVRLINAGNAECEAKVLQLQEASQQQAKEITAEWQGKLNAATDSYKKEIADLGDTVLKPYTLSVSKYTLRSSVPANPAPAGSAATAGAGTLHPSMVPESPGRLREQTDFALIQACDAVSAAYRVYYEAWP